MESLFSSAQLPSRALGSLRENKNMLTGAGEAMLGHPLPKRELLKSDEVISFDSAQYNENTCK